MEVADGMIAPIRLVPGGDAWKIALDDFSGRVAGKLVDELPLARNLVAGEDLTAVCLERGGIEPAARGEDDIGGHFLAPLLGRDTDDRCLAHGGVSGEHVLD